MGPHRAFTARTRGVARSPDGLAWLVELEGSELLLAPYISYQRVCCYLSTILARCGSTALAAALPPYGPGEQIVGFYQLQGAFSYALTAPLAVLAATQPDQVLACCRNGEVHLLKLP